MRQRLLLAALAAFALFAGTAAAAITTFTGLDAAVGPGGARPNSTAAATSWNTAASALGSVITENFESAPLGNFSSLPLTDVTVTLTGTVSDFNGGITNVAGTAIEGFNTTSGGAKFLRIVPPFANTTVTAVFTFARPIQAWGAMFTGVGTVTGAAVTVVFNDGTTQSFSPPGSASGGASFFGYTDPGKLITSVTVQEVLTSGGGTRDLLGIDDVQFVYSLPAALADCKKGGWEAYGIFKNQGDCVSFVATGGTNPPALGAA